MLNLSLFILTSLSLNFALADSWNGRIFRISDNTEINREVLLKEASEGKIIVMGETHITPEVQNTEAGIIRDVVGLTKSPFVFAWEFLAYNQQTMVNTLWENLVKGTLSGEEFIRLTLGNASNNTYIPVLKTVADLGGALIGINLTREEKASVVKGGIKAADPKLIPGGYEIGGEDYLARFKEIMGDHTSPEKLANYFDAQCLTDDVMAHEVSKLVALEKIFVIAGHFHTNYFDGFVRRLAIRLPNESKVIIRIIDASEYKEEELLQQLRHPKYGALADYAYFVKEPIAAAKKSY